ncbi:MAG: ribosomal-protein-alanine N-acetyltransferase [Acidiferrobacteraceae bacterium]|jgi:ribosomal-protein-alanine N-acetyltransferase|nr:ribosomal-protein-alanine N-acetyltransferase [Acidiferrobacteraceae bacterium]|tara:strand:+ start:17809 stop:18225 length:417 start_codon:yes stop_codon:yes gene_type:complete
MIVDDLGRVAELEQAVSPAPWSPGVFLDCLKVDYECWVLRSDDVFGYAIAALGAGEAHLLNIAVAPSKQGRGFGGQLLRKIIRVAREEDTERLLLEVRPSNLRAQAIYQKAGFELLSRRPRYYGPPQKEDALVYALEF